VQRLSAAFAPWGASKPEWQILSDLAGTMGLNIAWPDASSVFAELASTEPAFFNLSYDVLGEQGLLLRPQ